MKEEISVMYSEEVLNKKIGEMAEQIRQLSGMRDRKSVV